MATLEIQDMDAVITGSRRKMMTAGGAALAGMLFRSVANAQTTTATTLVDADYLNFALNFEYLDSNFYTLAVYGQTIDQAPFSVGITGALGTQGTVTVKPGGPTACKVPFKNALVANFASELSLDERNQVSTIRAFNNSTTLNPNSAKVSAIAQPAINLYTSFNAIFSLLSGPGVPAFTTFDPFADDASFLLAAYIFEDVATTAYTGAAPLLTDKSAGGSLDSAAGLQGVEAQHAGVLRTLIYGLDQTANTLQGQTVPAGTLRAIATGISKLRATVDGSGLYGSTNNAQGDDIGLGTQQVALNTTTANLTASTIVNATTTGSINQPKSGTTSGSLVFARTPPEVLRIGYANAAGTPGGFFPNGLNGNVK